MEKLYCADEERLALVNSAETSHQTVSDHGGEAAADDDDDEALSLCDLPLIHQSRKQVIGGDEIEPLRSVDAQESDFDFCSNKESEMCAADEVFYRGQILPFRHSVSSGKELSKFNFTRSESMDCHSSGGMITSRSSSINSRQSSSSGSSTAADAARHKKPPLNLFHSHPSPSPKIQANAGGRTNCRNCTKKKSSAWNIFRLGLVTPPPKIAFQDLKTRTNCKQFGSRNSTSSNSSSGSERKKPSPSFLSGCNCSLDAVDTVPSKAGIITRSVSDGGGAMRAALRVEEENLLAAAKSSTKKRFSQHRTFEWLKQLSIEGGSDES